jgi:hypothetical protein
MAKKTKKKLSARDMHRNVQDNLQALPYAVAEYERQGKPWRAKLVKWVGGPILRIINRVLSSQRYKGTEGQKLKQSEQMKRHLEQRRKAVQFAQGEMQKMQKQSAKRGGGKPR